MNTSGKAALAGAAVLLVTAGGAQPGSGGSSTEPPATSAAQTSETPTPAETTTSAEAAKITVPDVSGMNHQAAQDTMQAAGLYNLREVDSSGQHRAR
ncbi:hypothetical protein ABZU76_27170 [Amycolatopsis sp. NPDC005232]|uniref:hypothetical protein n=1 Tax=Amycolatopsis sp. NPDC005232 TaxID=3157027 RepID=UPI0033BD70CF